MTKQTVGIGSAANDASGDTLRVGATKINDNFNEIYTGFGDGTTLNTTISLGGLTLSLGSTDATPAFNLSDATDYPTSSLIGTISNAQLAGSIPNSKLATPNILFRGDAATAITQALGGTLQIAGGTGVTTAVSGNTVTITNDGYGTSNFTTDLSGKTTSDLAEGTNLYYTDARADARAQLKVDALIDSSPGALDTLNEIAAALGDDANFSTTITNSIATKLTTSDFNSTFDPRFNTQLATKDTDNLSEGSSNLYHTTARADARVDAGFTAKSTTNLSEGTNLYFTNARADARITNALIDEDNMVSDSATKLPSQQSVKAYVDSQILTKDNSDEIAEGSSNLYHTTARARGSISATGSLAYNSSTGVISFTQGNSDAVAEGSSNLYHTSARADARADVRIAASSINALSDVDTSGIANDKILKYQSSSSKWIIADDTAGGGGSATFTGLSDSPANYSSAGGKFVKVNSGATALEFSTVTTDNITEGSSNLYHTSARSIAAVVGSNLDMGSNNITTTGKILYSNLYSAEGDLPSASTYHGMFAHVHGTGKAYFSHASAWKKLLDESSSTTANLTEGSNLYYTDARVNTHLNTASASSGQILGWNGSDYAWVADNAGGGSAITVQEEGTSLATAAAVLNFVGSGVTATGTGTTKTITISASASSMSNAAVRAAVEAATDSNVFTDSDHTKLNAVEANAKDDLTGAEIKALYEAASDTNGFTDADHTKLNAIEASATADQTNAEIRAAVEAATNSNVFTDADHTKLNAVEASATADQTNAEIRTAVEAATDSNVFTDADHSKLNAVEASADVTDTTNVVNALSAGTNIAIASDGTISVNNIAITDVFTVGSESAQLALSASQGDVVVRTDENKTYIDNGGSAGTMDDFTQLVVPSGGVTSVSGHTGVVSPSQLKTAYEALSNTNAFTDADHSKLDAIEASATADQTDAQIRTAVEAASDSNVFTDADHTKLNAIEASANVTDTTNVVAALTAGSNITIASDGTIASTASGSALTIQEEGSSLSTAATTINFVGSGITATGTGTTKTVTVSGSGGATISSGAVSGNNLVLTKSDASTVTIDASTMINDVSGISTGNNWYYAFGDRANLNVNNAVSNLAAGVAARAPFYFGTALTRGKEMRYTANPNKSHTMGIWDGAEAHAGTYHSWTTDNNWHTGFKYVVNSGYLTATNTPLVNNTNGSNRYAVSSGDVIAIRFELDGHLTLLDLSGANEVIISKTSVPLGASTTSLNIQLGCDAEFVFPNASILTINDYLTKNDAAWHISYGADADNQVGVSTMTSAVWAKGPFYYGEELTRGSEFNWNLVTDRQMRLGIWDGAQSPVQYNLGQLDNNSYSTVFDWRDGSSSWVNATNTNVSNYQSGSDYGMSAGSPVCLRFLSDGHLELVDKTSGAENTIARTITPLSVASFKLQMGAWSNATFPNIIKSATSVTWEVAHDFDNSEDGALNGIEDHTVIKSGISIVPGQQFNINFNLVAQGDFFGTNYTGSAVSGLTNAEELLTHRFQYQTNESFLGPDWNFNTSAANYFLPTGSLHSWRRLGVNNAQGMVSMRYMSDNSIELWSETVGERIATAAAAGDGNPIHLFHGVKGNRTYVQIPGITKSNISATATGNADGMIVDFTAKTSNFTIGAATNYTAYLVNTSSNAVTATLPSSPSQGQHIKFIDLSGTAATNNIIINRNGNNINGAGSNITISTNRKTVDILFITGTGWIVSENP